MRLRHVVDVVVEEVGRSCAVALSVLVRLRRLSRTVERGRERLQVGLIVVWMSIRRRSSFFLAEMACESR